MDITTDGSAQATAAMINVARTLNTKSAKIRRFLWRFEHNESDIEDIVQDAMLAAIKCQGQFEARSTGETWFYGIATNIARHHVAKRIRENSRFTSDELVSELSEASQCPTEIMALHDLRAQLLYALNQLPQELSDTFHLACLQETPYAEVAEILNIPIGTVRSRVNRARMLIRKEIEAMDQPPASDARSHTKRRIEIALPDSAALAI